MKTMIRLLLFIWIFGCNSTRQNAENKCDCIKKDFKAEFTFKDSLEGPYYQSDDFVSNAIEAYTIESVRKKYSDQLKLTLVPNINMHDSTIVDTVYAFSNDRSKIEFYRAKQADFIQKFDISDTVFKLDGCIAVGLLKDSLAKQFGIKENIGDTITIGNMERTSTFTFYFKNNRIVRIGSYQYLD